MGQYELGRSLEEMVVAQWRCIPTFAWTDWANPRKRYSRCAGRDWGRIQVWGHTSEPASSVWLSRGRWVNTVVNDAGLSSQLDTQVQVEVEVNLRPTVSRPVCLDFRLPSGTCDQFFFPLEISRVCYFVAPSLTRGRVCNLLYNCFWALP
jgi:hypothetical protein